MSYSDEDLAAYIKLIKEKPPQAGLKMGLDPTGLARKGRKLYRIKNMRSGNGFVAEQAGLFSFYAKFSYSGYRAALVKAFRVTIKGAQVDHGEPRHVVGRDAEMAAVSGEDLLADQADGQSYCLMGAIDPGLNMSLGARDDLEALVMKCFNRRAFNHDMFRRWHGHFNQRSPDLELARAVLTTGIQVPKSMVKFENLVALR